MQQNKTAISVKDLSMAFEDKAVLWDIDLEIPEGVLMAIVGPNGAGKTTFLKAMLGVIKPAAGRTELFGEEIKKNLKKIAYVPQKNTIDWDFPCTVLDVVLMGTYGQLGWIKRPGAKQKQQAIEALDQVGMTLFMDRHISELSGGQQQRIFLARALVQHADVLLMDEPFVGVDAVTEREIIHLLKKLSSEGKTIIVVHHDLQTVKAYFNWIFMLNVRQIADGPVETVFTEENLRLTYGSRSAYLSETI
ncbi:MAG: metal ABC transporter ATP-binding protein [bacterium]